MALHNIRLNLELNPGLECVYTVTSPDIPELITEGSTPEEVHHNVQDAISSMVEVYQKQGWELPPALRPENAISIEDINRLQVDV